MALRKKILEVDALVQHDSLIVEVHPEVSFRALAGQPLLFTKKTWSGLTERRRLLSDVGIELPDELGPAGRTPADDILDAAAWSANRLANYEARSFPEQPPTDERGRPIAIWY